MMARTKPKRVQFGDNSEQVIPEIELTECERRTVWFSADELLEFRMHALELAEGNIAPSECRRGLESYTQMGTHQRRRRYIHYVLSLQAQNKNLGIEDPTGLRACAVAQSKSSMESALIRAAKDAAETFQGDAERKEGYAREGEDSNLSKHPGYKRGLPATIHQPRKNKTTATLA